MAATTPNPHAAARRAFFVLVGIAAAAYFIYPGPQMREAERKREAEVQRVIAERMAAREAEARAERERIERENAAALAAATRDDISRLVSDCRDQIYDRLSKNSPFAVHFPDYSPADLRKLGDIAAAFRKPLGRPSYALDTSGFNMTNWNIERIMHPEYPIRRISIAVEHARDGLSVRQYAAVYSCQLDGLKAREPDQDEFFFLD